MSLKERSLLWETAIFTMARRSNWSVLLLAWPCPDWYACVYVSCPLFLRQWAVIPLVYLNVCRVCDCANMFVSIWTCILLVSVYSWWVSFWLNSSGHSQSGQADCINGCRWPSVPASQVLLLPERYRPNVSLSLTGEDHPVPGSESHTHTHTHGFK